MVRNPKFLSFIAVLFGVYLSSAPLFAQSDECSVDNLDACRFDLYLYCVKKGKVAFSSEIVPDPEIGFTQGFTAQFTNNPPAKKMPLFAVDGEIESGNVNETRLTTLTCRGKTCTGRLSEKKLDTLRENFDVDQSFVNFVLRNTDQFGKDLCVGKLTNDPEIITDNDTGKRQICTFVPDSSNQGVTGTGFFVPDGYGLGVDDTFFHLAIQGLDSDVKYRGCAVVGENRYKKVFSFTPRTEGDTDETIYGDLTPKDLREFNNRQAEYSYELAERRGLFPTTESRNSGFGALFSPSLSLINKGVSTGSSSKTILSSNRATRVNRKKRRRRRKKQAARTRSLYIAADTEFAATTTTRKDEEEVFANLNFDPLGGELIISTSCQENVLERSVGTLVCGEAAEDDDRSCESFTSTVDGFSGTVCRETLVSEGQLSIRTKGLGVGSYTVCLNGSAIDSALTVSTVDDISFGELKLTDSSVLADGDSSFSFIDLTVGDVTSVVLSNSESCDESVATGSF